MNVIVLDIFHIGQWLIIVIPLSALFIIPKLLPICGQIKEQILTDKIIYFFQKLPWTPKKLSWPSMCTKNKILDRSMNHSHDQCYAAEGKAKELIT